MFCQYSSPSIKVISQTLQGANIHINAPFRVAALLPYDSLICPGCFAKHKCQNFAEDCRTQGASAQNWAYTFPSVKCEKQSVMTFRSEYGMLSVQSKKFYENR